MTEPDRQPPKAGGPGTCVAACLILAWSACLPGCSRDSGEEPAASAPVVAVPVDEDVGAPSSLAAWGDAGNNKAQAVELAIDESLPSPAAALARARGQWPQDGRQQARALADRIDQVGAALNAACGTEIRILLNETGRGGMATGDGVVYVDFSMVWRLSEDALAVLVAHEFAHEVLGHAEQLARLHYGGTGNPSYVQQLRGLERQADRYAGRILARTDYDPDGFKELLALGHNTEWADPLLRSYYPDRERIKTLMKNYRSERTRQGKPGVKTTHREG